MAQISQKCRMLCQDTSGCRRSLVLEKKCSRVLDLKIRRLAIQNLKTVTTSVSPNDTIQSLQITINIRETNVQKKNLVILVQGGIILKQEDDEIQIIKNIIQQRKKENDGQI